MHDSIAILDYGSQYAQLIARRVREMSVYSALFPWDTPAEDVLAINPKAFILSGGPSSVYDRSAPQLPKYVLESQIPILGICYGMQVLTDTLQGRVAHSQEREYGSARLTIPENNPLLPTGRYPVWMSHGDRIEEPPPGFTVLARSKNSPIAAIGNLKNNYYGVQFHPEVLHTPNGAEILRRFVIDICDINPDWTPTSIIQENVVNIRAKVGGNLVLSAVSGGVDSSVATAMVQRAIGDQLIAIFVDTGLLRAGEVSQVTQVLYDDLGIELILVDAVQQFMDALQGITEPEAKRKVIGELFIRIFEQQARRLNNPQFLVQGTIYPDVVESSAPDRAQSARIKTHHNVGGLPEEMQFQLIEPLRYLFKDEVRKVGVELGLPPETVYRQPFPGPGLAVRCLGEVNAMRLAQLRAADAILIEELKGAGLLHMAPGDHGGIQGTAQAFAVLLPIRSVGVMGDQRTYQETIAIRAVTTEDFMTAEWARLPHELLAKISNRIVNEVPGVNRVVYDITSKPPGTIEWE